MNPIGQMMECYGMEKGTPFTAEKQIELIKLLLDENKDYVLTLYFDTELRKYVMEVFETDAMFSSVNPENVNFEECLASLITQLYEYLPRQRVKEILEG